MERGELSDENSDSIPEIEPGLYRSKQQTTDLNNIVVEQPPNEDRVFKSSPSFSDWIPTENDA